MVYESFNNSKQKIQKTWDRSEDNENNLKDIPLITLDFNSINFNKKIVTIPIITKEVFIVAQDNVQTVLLKNFPEWVINMIEVTCVYAIEDGFAEFPLVDDFATEASKGTLKVGDISIIKQEFDYWFNNVDEKNFNLKIFLSTIILQVKTLRPNLIPAFLTNFVPSSLTLSLKIVNQRIYETMNSHKE